ncbi:unnamed protein product [Porites lobata]|uniref:Coiled-coil domain-containing protein 9-like n=1 Tax=Porites lobata TaxID=104759 RepID=A0ABN8QMH8_9CNID|nr:unnamed protein product [Porites lobata]
MTSKPNQKENSSETDHAAGDEEKAKKEELVEARMRMIRKKNEELLRRQKEIEEDRKNADMYSEMAAKKNPGSFPSTGVNKEVAGTGLGRGRGRGLMLREMRKETLKAKQWEAKRRENIQKEEEERKKKAESSSRTSRFLVDNDRVDMSKTSGRNERSWGGASFNQVINRVQREKEGFRPGRNKGNIELTMSGKERREYSQWKEERSRIDEERKARQKKTGNWSRAWDQTKSWDSRKKMWVNENDNDDSFRNTRRRDSDDADDWGSDNRNRRRDHGRQEWDRRGPRSNSRFAQHDDREPVKEEDWGDTGENKSVELSNSGRMMACEEDWGDDSTENTKDINHTDPANGMPVTEECGQIKESKVIKHIDSGRIQLADEKGDKITKEALAEPKALGSTTEEEAVMSHPPDKTMSNPSLGEKQLCTTESKEITNTPMEEHTHHGVDPKPQREFVKQRRRLLDSDGSDQVKDSKELAPVKEFTQDRTLFDKKDRSEVVTVTHEHADVKHGDQDEISSTSEITEMKLSHHDREGNGEKNPIDAENRDSVPKNVLDDKNQGTTIPNVLPTEKEKTDKVDGTITHKSGAEKAHLPKINTKVEKKVTFDSEENENFKETNAEDSPSLIGDIPPTPDFLKIDHNLDWGDIEVDADESEAIEPKW